MTPKRILFFLALLFSLQCFSQIFLNDIQLIANKKSIDESELLYYKRAGNNQTMMQSKHSHSFVSKINPINSLLKATMFFYQNVLSAQLSKECPYEITCSNFSKKVIREFGIVKGVFLSADRITRCNRISLQDVNLNNIDPATGSIKDTLSKYCVND